MGALLTCHLPLFWSFSPFFGISWYFRCILYLPRIYTLISYFSKEPWFLLVGKGQDLGVSVVTATGMTLLLDFLVDNAREYTHEYTYMYRCKYIHSYTCAQMNMLLNIFSSVQFSLSVVSDSLRPHESQHARPPCPSPTPGVHSDSCPWS